ncbi:splicing factor 3B subunit 2 [Encephalitozoon romaleae SJ-2008]|uniref:Splicing factor 3B subunit 2 n=1 Tax=Encephalitozoon romaleae (strain SJ-2008) TaxID=1178016 RepID=I7AQG3_ENCRO|nr:splicing factor 3B subunit 2 [Encephalitozoon romaleae SJ-2008]AFN84119.1 splicing factor 3B subunit 2 [Encephalitozoon romaleae SJ-2008]
MKSRAHMKIGIDDEYGFIHRIRPSRSSSNKRQRKREALQNRYEDLKLIVPHPELLEIEDSTCPDPIFHNEMKGRGGVPVPKHWKSSSGRMFPRSYYKPSYRIPRNVMKTGIPELRKMMKEREAGMSLRERIREKLYPKLGRSLVDQQVLYEAFFLEKGKPYLSNYGEFFEPGTDSFVKRCSPGVISNELMEALGIDDGAPPPWLFNMQKHGMPPSYPDAKIPGLNVPIPEGCSYGYQPLGWGEPLFEVSNGTTEKDTLQKDIGAIYNSENQYTRPVYIEDFEERVVINNNETTQDESPRAEVATKEDTEGKRKGRDRKEKLYKSIKF